LSNSCKRFASQQINDADVVPARSATQQMTTLSLTEEITRMSYPRENFQPDPYPNKTPTTMLTREFLLSKASLLQDQSLFFTPIKQILAQDFIQSYLTPFKYIRTGVKLRIVLTSDSTLYGAVMVSALPYQTDGTAWTSLLQQSQSDLHLLDIGQQESLDIYLPWVNPAAFASIEDTTFPEWRVLIHPIIVLQPGEETPSVNVSVFASLVGPRAMGYDTPVFQAHQLPLHEGDLNGGSNRLLTALGVVGTGVLSAGGGAIYNTLTGRAETLEDINILSHNAEETPDQEIFPDGTQTDVRLNVMDNFSFPSASYVASRTMLGDCRGIKSRRSMTMINDIARTPYYIEKVLFSETFQRYSYSLSLLRGSHAEYLFRMFRYWRGSFNIMLKFYSSSLYGAKFRVTLYPNGYVPGTEDADITHLPTEIISVKGSLTHHVQIPYLQAEAWQEDTVPTIQPSIVVELLSLPPKFNGDTVLFPMLVFACPADDFQLTSLQSCVPGNFQSSLRNEFKNIATRGAALPVYMASNFSVDDVLSRYSYREAQPEQVFPGPVKILDFSDYSYDNFDFLNQIFMFYSGSLRMKMLFSHAPTDGMLQLVIRNRTEEVGGDSFRAGNSMVASQQALWPVLDAQVPYLSQYPFGSMWNPLGQTNLTYSEETVVEKLLVARGHDYAVTCQLPVPDAYFQASAYKRFEGRRLITFSIAVTTATTSPVIKNFVPGPGNVPNCCSVHTRILPWTSSGATPNSVLWAINPAATPVLDTVQEVLAGGSLTIGGPAIEDKTAVLFPAYVTDWTFVLATPSGANFPTSCTFLVSIFISPLDSISSLVSVDLPMETIVVGRVGGRAVDVQPPSTVYVEQLSPVQVVGTNGLPVYVSNYPNLPI